MPAVILSLLPLVGCQQQRNQYQAPPPPTVTVALPERRTVTIYHQYTGNTQASNSAQLQARVQGTLQKILFKDGATVSEGQLLMVIDPRPFEAALAQAQAAVQSAKATVVQQQSIYRRDVELLPSGAVTQQQADIDRGNLQVAEAAQAQAEANLRTAQLNLSYCEIRAPFAGHMGRRLIDVGNLVTANSTVLSTIDRYDPMYVYFTVSEANYLAYLGRKRTGGGSQGSQGRDARHDDNNKQSDNSSDTGNGGTGGGSQTSGAAANDAASNGQPNHPIELGLLTEQGYPHRGHIDFINNTVDPLSGTILVRGVFDNPAPYVLVPGLFARVRVPVEEAPGSLLVPEVALGSDQAGEFVMVVGDDNRVVQRHVETGEELEEMRVITRGLAANDRVIVSGLQQARPDEVVKVQTRPAASVAGTNKDNQRQ